jgi:hypothetical protein
MWLMDEEPVSCCAAVWQMHVCTRCMKGTNVQPEHSETLL